MLLIHFTVDIDFNENGTGYYPILYHNDYWNLAQEYLPLNDTVKSVHTCTCICPIRHMCIETVDSTQYILHVCRAP